MKMLHYDRIDVFEGNDILYMSCIFIDIFDIFLHHETSASKECDISHWYFLNKGFKFQPYVCNGCQDLLMTCMNLCNIAILKIKNDYHYIITEAIT